MKNLADCTAGRAGARHGALLTVIILASLCLNLAGNSWGTPDRWHPDEMDSVAAGMVAQKTLNPHFFPYGGLHYYVLALTSAVPVGAYNYFFDPKPATDDARHLDAWRERKDTRVRILARATSAVLAALTVLVTYVIASLLFSTATGLLAATFLALSTYFVLIAHFATVDSAANLWYWLACLLALLGWKRDSTPWFAAAAFTIGLACGTKIDRLLAVVPWLVALLFRQGLRPRLSVARAVSCAALIPLGFVVANPTLLFSFFEFVDGTSRDLLFNALRGNGTTAFVPMLSNIANGMSWPLFAIAAMAILYLAYEAIRGNGRREYLWLLSCLLPMYLLFGSRFSLPWYCVFFYPGLAVAGAEGAVMLMRSQRRAVRFVAVGVMLAAIGWSLLRSIGVVEQFTGDSRYAAARWIEANVPHGAVIEVSRRGPPLAADHYAVYRDPIPQDYYADAEEWRQHLQDSSVYRGIQASLGAIARWTGSTHAPTYSAWFERVRKPKVGAESPPPAPAAPDYRVVVDYIDEALLGALQATDSGYQLVTEIRYRNSLGMDVPFPFVNPTIHVFRHVGTPVSAATTAPQESTR
jgi:hypothetical protein